MVVSVGGQTPNNLALQLHNAGAKILGTSPVDIDCAEDRHKFSRLLDSIGVDQPAWSEVTSLAEAVAFADRIGYPVLLRPSYVLSGAAMGVATNARECEVFLKKAAEYRRRIRSWFRSFLRTPRRLMWTQWLQDGQIIARAVIEHVENAGVHSGDATLVFPPQRTYLETSRQVERIAARIAKAMNISGPFNVQFLAHGTNVKVIECNLRASRSFPFVSKVYKLNFIELAMQAMLGIADRQGFAFGA